MSITIDEAIEILVNDNHYLGTPYSHKLLEAQKLGIEALKGIKKVRKTLRPYVEALLPGEAEK